MTAREHVEVRPSMLSCGICEGPLRVLVYADNSSRHQCIGEPIHTDWRFES